jgi:uncharacterized protein (DUF2225 family)
MSSQLRKIKGELDMANGSLNRALSREEKIKQIIKAVTVIDFDSSFIEKSSDCPMCRDDFERALRVFKAIISVIDKDGVYDNKFHNIIGECDG